MFNVVILSGRLTSDPELKTTPSGVYVCSFTIAVERKYKQGEDRQADFINIVAWRNNAEFICKYFGKGSMIAVEGEIQTRTYEDKNGNKRKAVEVVVDSVSFCGSKSESNSGNIAPIDPENDPLPQFMDNVDAMFNGAGNDAEDDDLPF